MSMFAYSRQLGLAAFAVGLSLAAPQAAGVAAADSSGADSASAVQADSTAGPLTRQLPTPLAPSLQMRTLFTQCGVVAVARVHHSVVAVDAEQLAADVTE